jgi:hypothetical protein
MKRERGVALAELRARAACGAGAAADDGEEADDELTAGWRSMPTALVTVLHGGGPLQ